MIVVAHRQRIVLSNHIDFEHFALCHVRRQRDFKDLTFGVNDPGDDGRFKPWLYNLNETAMQVGASDDSVV